MHTPCSFLTILLHTNIFLKTCGVWRQLANKSRKPIASQDLFSGVLPDSADDGLNDDGPQHRNPKRWSKSRKITKVIDDLLADLPPTRFASALSDLLEFQEALVAELHVEDVEEGDAVLQDAVVQDVVVQPAASRPLVNEADPLESISQGNGKNRLLLFYVQGVSIENRMYRVCLVQSVQSQFSRLTCQIHLYQYQSTNQGLNQLIT
jgi:hypothetical protein